MDIKTGNQQMVKSINLHRIVAELRGEDLSRVELARRLNMGKSTVTALVNILVDSGLVLEGGQVEAVLGRSPTLLTLNNRWKYVMAIHFDSHDIHLALIDLKGGVFNERKLSLIKETTWESSISAMKKMARSLCVEAKVDWETQIIGIALALPGIIDNHRGTVWSRIHDDAEISLQSMLEQVFEKKVLIDNDVRALMMSLKSNERENSAYNNVVTILVNEGVGAGIVTNGEVVRGSALGAGQIGHIKVSDESNCTCHCGKIGCLEACISNDAIKSRFSEMCANDSNLRSTVYKLLSISKIEEIQVRDIARMAKEGIPEAQEIMNYMIHKLATALHVVVQLLNPSEIVLCGPIFDEIRNTITDRLIQLISELSQLHLVSSLRISIALDFEKHFIRGIANLILDGFYSLPIYDLEKDQNLSFVDSVIFAEPSL